MGSFRCEKKFIIGKFEMGRHVSLPVQEKIFCRGEIFLARLSGINTFRVGKSSSRLGINTFRVGKSSSWLGINTFRVGKSSSRLGINTFGVKKVLIK